MIPHKELLSKHRKNKKSRSGLFGRYFLLILLGFILFFGFGLLSRIKSMQVSLGKYEHIIVTNTDAIDISLQQYLHDRFLYPRSNRLWFSNKKAERYIMSQFPRISSVHISSSKGILNIKGKEREGYYLWCGNEVVPIRLDTPCYFADSTGFIFDEAPYFSGTSYLRLYGDISEGYVIGTQVFSPEVFELYRDIQKAIKPFDLTIQALHMLSNSQFEFILASNNEISRAPRIKYYLLNDTDIIVNNIERALAQEKVLFEITHKYDRLEYLDTRFKNQFIYKFFDDFSQDSNSVGYEHTSDTETNIQKHQNLSSGSEE